MPKAGHSYLILLSGDSEFNLGGTDEDGAAMMEGPKGRASAPARAARSQGGVEEIGVGLDDRFKEVGEKLKISLGRLCLEGVCEGDGPCS